MGASSCSDWGVKGGVLALLAIAFTGVAAAPPALAAPTAVLSVNGSPLDAALLSSGTVTVSVNAPAGVGVKFKLDGSYLGEDRTSPYSWPIVAGAGSHRMEARWEQDGRQEAKTTFVVASASVPTPVPTVKPTVPKPAVPVPTMPAPGALTVNGKTLAGSTQPTGTFTVTAHAPAGATVKFKIDGTYLGQDRTAPYTWPIQAGSGTHRIDARWSGGDVRAEFAVASDAGAQPSVPVPSVPVPPVTVPTVPVPPPAPGVVRVATSTELTAALNAARPGQTIQLADGRYVGQFASTASGTASAPIVLSGSRKAILSTGSTSKGYGLHLTGSYWNVRGISVTGSAKGIVLDGSAHTTISGVDVGHIGAEAVHFRTNSSDGVIENSIIHDTGLDKPAYGEGVYIGSAKSNWKSIMGSAAAPDRSDRIIVRNNRISNTTAEGIDVKEGTTGGTLTGNVFTNAGHSGENYSDSWVDIKGNGYRVTGNSGSGTKLDAFQVHTVLPGWGTNNVFAHNTVLGGVPGYEVWVQSGPLGTVVTCGPSGAARGLSNIACTA